MTLTRQPSVRLVLVVRSAWRGSAENATALFSTTAVTLDFADGTSLIFGSSSNSFTTAFATGFSHHSGWRHRSSLRFPEP